MLEYDYCLDYTQLKSMASIKPGNDATINNIHHLNSFNGEVYYKHNHKDKIQNLKTIGILILKSMTCRYSKSVFQ